MYDNWGSTSGGHLKDMANPRARLFPRNTKKKRKVFISIMKFSGSGVHYHVSMRQEDNPIIDLLNKTLRMCWDDTEGRGERVNEKFNTPNEANNFVKQTLAEKFRGHEARTAWGESRRWHYQEGD